MSRDELLPKVFAYVNRKSHTPTWCIIFTSTAMVFILGVEIEAIIKLASAFKILAFFANEVSFAHSAHLGASVVQAKLSGSILSVAPDSCVRLP